MLSMETLFTFTSPPGPCGYLPDRQWKLRYEVVRELTAEEYAAILSQGWRRFGYSLFRPECDSCNECKSVRLVARNFRPSRTQQRVRKLNTVEVQLTIGEPEITEEKMQLYLKYHAFQSDMKGWPEHRAVSESDYAESFVDHPFPTEEWQYRIDGKLIGVGYVDALPTGLSAIYFYYDPEERWRSLGTWNVMRVIEEAAVRNLEYVFLGFYVSECRSLSYKANFRPNELLDLRTGLWLPYRED